ncbi:MAG: hypothetical protein VB084_02260 [Syntrophomonadaceae bacterium]|nr:hypothetical protein [Syntrophomonadaceae bacterium]
MQIDKRAGRMIVGIVSGTFLLLIGIMLICRLSLEPPEGQISDLDEKVPYGEFLSWDAVDKIFPKSAKATVVDYDTGMQFEVQRRGGSNHADVQPLTANDTAIMKSIYAGKWGWRRKAVILQLKNGLRIAASMNGMPHGQGAIQNNNFDGHFCIHFRDCKTHASNRVDLAHQMMVWKAGNVVDQQLQSLTPAEILTVFFTALNQHELNIAGKLVNSEDDIMPMMENLGSIETIRAENIKKVADNSYSISVSIIFNDSNREYRKNMVINLVARKAYWQIDANVINILLDKRSMASFQAINTIPMEQEDWELVDND